MNKILPQRQFLLPLSLALLCSNTAFAQKENDNWIFGSGCYISFADDVPEVKTPLYYFATAEGCSSVSSSAGELLFYTDGTTVRNKNHQVMKNGTGLLGDPSSTSSSVVVPFPGHPLQYYIFCVESNMSYSRRLTYNIVDLYQENGLGEVLTKNTILLEPSDEKIAVTRHCNGRDFWIAAHGANTAIYYMYLLTDSGLSKEAVINNQPRSYSSGSEIGYIKFSPDGKWFANARCLETKLELYHFNRSNGQLSFFAADDTGTSRHMGGQSFYGLAFSPNGTMLYTTFLDKGYVFQYNLLLDSINFMSGRILLKKFDNRIGAIQLARNNKLYFTNGYNSPFLHCIEQPEKRGLDCILSPYAIKLKSPAHLGLPTYVESMEKYYTLGNGGIITHSRYTLNANIDNARYIWSTGDTTQTITVSQSGKYWVQVNEKNACKLLRDTIELIFVKQKFKLIHFDQTAFEVCNGGKLTIPNFVSDSPGVSFYWKNSDTSIGLPAFGIGQIGSFSTHNVQVKTRATITVYPHSDTVLGSPLSFDIIVYPRTRFLPQKTEYQVCGSRIFTIDKFRSTSANMNYQWSCDNSSIGLNSSGNGNILPFKIATIKRDTNALITVIVQSYICPADTLKISLNLHITPVLKDTLITICSGIIMPEIQLNPMSKFSSISWQVLFTKLNIPASGSKIIPAVSIPATTARDTTRMEIIATMGNCSSDGAELDIVALPRPKILPNMIRSYQFCCGDNLLLQNIKRTPKESSISWTNNNTISGIPASGQGDIKPLRLHRLYAPSKSIIRFKTNYEGCQGDSIQVEVLAKAVAAPVQVPDIYTCSERRLQTIDLKSIAGGLDVRWWSQNGKPFILTQGQDSVHGFYIPELFSEQTIKVNLFSSLEGCKGDTSMFNIHLEPKPSSMFTFDSTSSYDATQLINLSMYSDAYLWKFSDSTYDRSVNPTHTFIYGNTYRVSLYSSNDFCTDSFSKFIHIPLPPYMYIPSAFSPDGNSSNDLFKVYHAQDNKIEFHIYNRWGEEIYSTSDNTPWNGEYKEQPCAQGVYVYTVLIKQDSEKKYVFRGTLTLLR